MVEPQTFKKIMIGCPSHGGGYGKGAVMSLIDALTSPLEYFIGINLLHGSCLCNNFNMLMVQAMKENFDYLVILHDDVGCLSRNWLGTLLDVMKESECVACCPTFRIKDYRSLTVSTVLKDNKPEDYFYFDKMTLEQCEKEAGDKGWFFADLINTGCLLIDLNHPVLKKWKESEGDSTVWFHMEHKIMPEGECVYFPEDYRFSRKIREYGGKVVAVNKIKTEHIGAYSFINDWNVFKKKQ